MLEDATTAELEAKYLHALRAQLTTQRTYDPKGEALYWKQKRTLESLTRRLAEHYKAEAQLARGV